MELELLAPAGDYECFLAAVNAGADAVYLAGERFGARAFAKNFSDEEILKAIRVARLLGVKIYLTVNTLIKESEIQGVCDFIRPFFDAGLHGVILQDIGAAGAISKEFPGLKLLASTQMTVTSPEGVGLCRSLGFSRVILSRELSLKEIQEICESTDLEIEVFIHGAMCYCYSGQCLFSSMLGDRSANRGRCAGPCRMEYSYGKYSSKYLISLRDMDTIDFIPDLIRAGVTSFKIEGRMKPKDYVYGVTSVYRKYIDKYLNDPYREYKVEDRDRKLLNSVYVRTGPGSGYLSGGKGSSMISLDSPAYTPSDESILKDIRVLMESKRRTLPVSVYGSFKLGKPASLTLVYGEMSVTVTGDVVEPAKNAPLSVTKIKENLSKLSNTYFSPETLEVEADEGIFMAVSGINELRRKAVEALENEILCNR